MSSGQLRSKIFQLMTFIDGQFSGSYDYQDMYDTDFGHLATIVDMIDAYNMKNPDSKMDYPKTRDETMRPVDWTPYLVNETRTVRITKSQLKRIIKEEKQKLQEMEGMTYPGVYDGIFDGVMDMLEQEAMAGGLDLLDPATVESVASALRDAATQIVNDSKLA